MSETEQPWYRNAIMRNFVRMAVFFSINHACVVTVLSLAINLLGGQAGSFQSATLYLTYAVTALLFSAGAVQALGARRALVVATCLYSFYVATFPIALIVPGPESSGNSSANLSTIAPSTIAPWNSTNSTNSTTDSKSSGAQLAVVVVGGLVGGVGGGFIWAAQGTYFTLSAKLYAADRGIPLEKATMSLASIFAAIYLGIELLTKLLPLALLPLNLGPISLFNGQSITGDKLIVVVTYAVLAILAVLGMFGITDLRDVKPAEQGELSKAKPATDGSKQSLLAPAAAAPPRPRADLGRVLAAVALWRDDPLVLLLNPIQMTFGFCAGMLAAQITGGVVQTKFKDSVVYAAMLTSLPPLVAGILQYPFKLVANRFDKLPLMLLGLSGFVALSCIVYFLTENELKEWAILVPLYLLQGLGRACYEGTNRALYADFFPNNSAAAFSNIVMANGVSSALLFFVKSALPKTDNKTLPLLTLCSAVPTVFFYLIAELIHRRRRRQAEIEKVV